MTHKNAVCPNLKWTITSETINHDGRFEEVIRTYVCKYKGYTFDYRIRDYDEWATDDEPSYSEREESIYCSETWDLVAEDWECNDYAVVDYVKLLTKKQHTKDVLIKMLMKTDLISYFNDCKYNSYNHRTWDFNIKMMKLKFKDKQKLFKKELEALPLYKLEELVKWCNITKAMKLCSKPNLGFYFNEWSKTVIGWDWKVYASEVCVECIDDDWYDRDVACSIHSPFYLLTHYAGMQF